METVLKVHSSWTKGFLMIIANSLTKEKELEVISH